MDKAGMVPIVYPMVTGTFMDGEPHTFFIIGGALVALYGLYLLVQ